MSIAKDHLNRILDGTKIDWYHDKVRAWDRGERIAPVTIDMALTTTCNMGCEFCVAPATKILMADFTYKRIADIVEGDMVMGFDEYKPKGTYATYYPTKVTATMKRQGARLHRLYNDETGDYLFITNEHPVLCEGHRWRKPSKFKEAKVRYFAKPVNTDYRECFEYKLGYLKGCLEGDGTFGTYKQDNKYSNQIQHKFKLQMDDLEAVERCARYIEDLLGRPVCRPKDKRIITLSEFDVVLQLKEVIKWKESWNPTLPQMRGYLAGIFDAEGSCGNSYIRIAQKNNKQVIANINNTLVKLSYKFKKERQGFRILGGFSEMARFFGECKPAITRKRAKLYNKSIPTTLEVKHDNKASEKWVHNIETESHTYVANGFAVHNCYRYLQHNKQYKITKEHMTDFLDDCAEMGVKGVSLVSDGESSISPAYEHTIVYGHSKGLSMASGTNGYLLKPELQERILPCLTYLRINISAGELDRYNEIMGASGDMYSTVCNNIRHMVESKEAGRHQCTIGMQMVFKPNYKDQLIPLSELSVDLGVDYLVIKHCSDDEFGTLGVNYGDYKKCYDTLRKAESLSTDKTTIKVKWSKIDECNEKGAIRSYQRCYGPPFLLQISGTGLVAPCGMLFNQRYKWAHMGNITEQRFKNIWKSEKYWKVMKRLSSDKFNAQKMCGTLCLQHSVNKYLDKYKKGEINLVDPTGDAPDHLSFV